MDHAVVPFQCNSDARVAQLVGVSLALIAKRIEPDRILVLVGTVLTVTSGYGLYRLIA